MAKAYHEALHPLGNLGIQVSMAALENTHIPAHWHEAMEILFCLNGSVRIHIEHEHLTLQRNQLIVFDSKEVHSIHSDSKLYMFLCIHVDKKQLSAYCPDLELYHIKCRPISLDDSKHFSCTKYTAAFNLLSRSPERGIFRYVPRAESA